MCFQPTYIHEHCDCIYDQRPIIYCDSEGSPGHVIERKTVEVDKPCDDHPGSGATPLGVAFFRRQADLEDYEDAHEQSGMRFESKDLQKIQAQRQHLRREAPTAQWGESMMLPTAVDSRHAQQDEETSTPYTGFESRFVRGKLAPVAETVENHQQMRDGHSLIKPDFECRRVTSQPTYQLTQDLHGRKPVAESFVYHSLPLDIDEIRVIRLQPAPSLVSPVVAKLAVVRIGDEAVQYDALSYRWGDAGDLERVIWADSICINQKDTEERVAQVMDMGTIYREAACVRIWLGEEARHSAVALSLLNNCDELQHDTEIMQRIIDDAEGVDGLTEVLSRPYWSRMWIFQEITLARRAIVHCGIFTADWWTLKRLDIIIGNPSKWAGAHRGGAVHGLRKAFMNIAHLIIPFAELGSIDNVLFPTSQLEATDDRDKLFALVGVCNIGDYLMVDYFKSTRETYADFTRCFSQSTGELSLLWAAGLHRPANGPNIGLPSWVPDFRGKSGRDPVFLAAGYSRVFDASAGKRFSEPRNPSRRTGWDAGVLEVEGLLIDQVTMAQPLDSSEVGRMEAYRTFEVCSGGCHPSGKSRIEAFLETMIFDADEPKSGDSDRIIGEKQGRRLQHMHGLMKDLETLQTDLVPRKRDGCVDFSALFGLEVVGHYDDLGISQPDTLEGHRKAFVKDVMYNAGSTSSLLSTGGGYFGRCNDSAQSGDIIALLSGCSFPVVLRKSPSGFEFVGVAYVSGLMYGEMMDSTKSDLVVQIISLV
ncbi:hypothetical protein CTA1_9465 [Colletotrichum tanaceti]|uniref:Heterokaryon incompatibility domain-containing protein n=1 Tax=Colletotrichum tanaceti TaxID=1306861 RepID=A0A4V6DG63_9PEZI|nr:hypothetical protein CTA1_9465 [Colletotrichum tanaceti]